MAKKLTDYKVLSFDCYGTLIDWESGIWDALQPLLMENKCSQYHRQALLMLFAKTESQQQLQTPHLRYQDLLVEVHKTIATTLGLTTNTQLDNTFADGLAHWPAFADSADALRALQQDFKLVVLSNVSDSGFAWSNKKLGMEFDAVYTAEQVGCYKPNAKNFAYMLNKIQQDFAIEQQQILHVAQSLFHDHAPAKQFGLDNVWIDRQGLQNSDNWGATAVVAKRPQTDFIFPDMQSFVAAVRAEKA